MFGFWSVSARKISSGISAITDAVQYLIMKMSGNGYNKGKNNIFVDESRLFNGPITVNGNSTQGSAGPYGTNWSCFFDGTGDYLTVPANTAFAFDTGDFTVEAWIMRTGGSGIQPICQSDAVGSSTNNKWFLAVNGTGLFFGTHASGGFNVQTTTTFNTGVWYHVAVSRSSGTMYMFINGVNTAFTTGGNPNGYNLSQNGVSIGAASTPLYWTGYISNLRVVKGTAVYTANFTSSTTALTAVTNTSLLTCQNSYFIDNSPFAHTITQVGDTRTSSFEPFGSSEVTSIPTGSVYFDGTGDYLNIANNAALNMNASDFTIECWVYPVSFSAAGAIFTKRANFSIYGGISLALTTSGTVTLLATVDGSSWGINSTSSINAIINNWNHVAVTRSGSTWRVFVNGVVGITATLSGTVPSNTASFSIGASAADGSFPIAASYISNFRIVKDTALYTAAFTPSTTALTAVANTSLLTCQGGVIADNSSNNFTITVVGDSRVTANSPFANSTTTITPTAITTQSVTPASHSVYFDGAGDYLSVASNAAIVVGSSDFTIEAWVYLAAPAPWTGYIFGKRAIASSLGIIVGFEGASVPRLLVSVDNTNWNVNINSSISVIQQTWTHIAVTRSGNTWRLFVNGQQGATATVAGTVVDSGANLTIGANAANGTSVFPAGYISNFRLVKGTALYTAAFTPLTTALTAVANTSLLTCQSPTLIDNSTNAFSITANGDARPVINNPFTNTIVNTPVTQIATPSSYGVYFDGTGDFLNTPSNVALSLDNSSFTIEFWFNASTSQPTTRTILIGSDVAYAANFWSIQLNNTTPSIVNKINFWVFNINSSASVITGSTTIIPNTWYHVALVRNSNTFTLYLNGVSDGTATNAASLDGGGSKVITIAKNLTDHYAGCISNLRVVKGTAVYTANFTPSTSPLTAVANTSLLTCQSPTLIDNSTNAFSITANGDARPVINNPFTNSTSNTTNWSGYFDGTGDMLTVTNLTGPGTGDFTYECWVYPTSSAVSYRLIFGIDNYGASAPFRLYQYGTNFQFWYTGNAGSFINSNTIVMNQWYHLAATRSGSSLRFFVNGVQVGSTITQSASYPTSNFRIGMDSGSLYPFVGYISNVRVVNGTALYTSAFTPSTSQLTAVSGTSLLTCQGPRFIDNSTNNFAITVSGDAKTTMFDPFLNKGSMNFNGSTSFLSIADNSAVRLGSVFTIEYWVYLRSYTSPNGIIFSKWDASTGYSYISGINTAGQFGITMNTNVTVGTSTLGVPLNSWTHVAICRDGSSWRYYLNGMAAGSFTNATVPNPNSTPLDIGRNRDTSVWFTNGNLRDFRISNVVRYNGPFIPPTTNLTAESGTTLLIPGINNFNDISSNRLTVTSSNVSINTSNTGQPQNPYDNYHSYFFNGSASLAIASNAAFGLGTGAFTIECWVYPSSNPANGVGTILDLRSGPFAESITVRINNSLNLLFYDGPVNVERTTTSYVFNLNEWHHLAITRPAGATTANIWVNGTLVDRVTISSNLGSAYSCLIGSNRTAGYGFNGYINNLRIVKDCLYTLQSPPTPYTNSVDNLPVVARTSLLTCNDKSIVDVANNYAITNTSVTTTNQFVPFNRIYSTYFDGTTGVMTINHSNAINIRSGDFTIECWFNAESPGATNRTVMAQWSQVDNNVIGYIIRLTSSNLIEFFWGPSNAAIMSPSTVVSMGTWNHVAVTRNGNTFTMYLNGTSISTVTNSTTGGYININHTLGNYYGTGGSIPASGVSYYKGYISNARITKGLAVYTSNFTPSTYPLVASANTGFLGCQCMNMLDNSGNNLYVFNSSGTRMEPIHPFATNRTVTTTNTAGLLLGGAGYFDGNGDNITLPGNDLYAPQTSEDFTIECWIKFNTIPGSGTGFLGTDNAGTRGWLFFWNSTNSRIEFYAGSSGGATYDLVSDMNVLQSPRANVWYHLAVTRQNSTIRSFANGVLTSTATSSAAVNRATLNPLVVGSRTASTLYTNCSIAGVRVLRGSCQYVSNFVPSAVPPVVSASASALLNFRNGAVYDAVSDFNFETVGDAAISTTQSRSGGSSIYFDGTGDYMAANNPDLAFGTGDFTIECWQYSEDVSGAAQRGTFQTSTTAGGLAPSYNTGISLVMGTARTGTTTSTALTGALCVSIAGEWVGSTTSVVSVNTWTHIAVVRSSGVVTLYVNGTSVDSRTANGNITGTNIAIGGYYSIPYLYRGYVDDFRIHKGYAKYTTNFTPT
jgi:hypothetical protein